MCFEDILNKKQKQIFETYNNYFAALQTSKIADTTAPTPLRLLVHGSPGCGKSYLTHKIFNKAKQYDLQVGCCAYMGKAATLMPKGRTIHNFLGLKRCKKNALLFNWSDLKRNQSYGKTLNHFKRDKIGMIIIDEISMLTPKFLATIDQRLRTLTGNHKDPFGNLSVILMGDFFQIPPVQGVSLFSSVLNNNFEEESSSPLIHGSWLFSNFKMIELNEQMRAPDDERHMEMLNQMRIQLSGQPAVSAEHLKRYSYFSSKDVLDDKSWLTAPVIVLNNKERVHLNAPRSKLYAKISG